MKPCTICFKCQGLPEQHITTEKSTLFIDLKVNMQYKTSINKKNKMDKAYKHLQSQGHIKMAYHCSKFNAYCLLTCREHATLIFAFANPL